MGHHSTLIGGGKGEGCLFCSDAHTIVANVVNVLTRIVAKHQSGPDLGNKNHLENC